MLNLEPLAAQAAAEMVGSDATTAENMTTKSLMVLSEQGLFAFGLFLASRKREQDIKAADNIHRAVAHLLYKAELAVEENPRLFPDYYRKLTETHQEEDSVTALQRILLTKQVIEIALMYGRYQAKSLSRN
jgi:hypothetical protein